MPPELTCMCALLFPTSSKTDAIY